MQRMQRMQNTNLRGNDKSNEFAQFWKLTIVARWFLLISGPRVRVPGGAPDIERQIVRFGVLFCYVTPKNRGLHGQCTVFARSAFSWESSAWAGIALKCVVNFASGQQSQTELCLYFGVCILQQLQQSGHRSGALNGLHIAAGDHQLIGGTGMAQTVKDNAGELRVCVLPFGI